MRARGYKRLPLNPKDDSLSSQYGIPTYANDADDPAALPLVIYNCPSDPRGTVTYAGSSLLNSGFANAGTTSYAAVGAALLIMSRQPRSNPLIKHLGGVTMLVVVARLLVIDLSSVGTIWRVLLFLLCGAVFLYTGYKIQPRSAEKSAR